MYADRIRIIRRTEIRRLDSELSSVEAYFDKHAGSWSLAMESTDREFTCSLSGDGRFVVSAGTPGSPISWFAADPAARAIWRGEEFSWPTAGGNVTLPTYVRLDRRLAELVAKQWMFDGALSQGCEWVDLM